MLSIRALGASVDQRCTSVDVKGLPDGSGEVNCSIALPETAVKLSYQRISNRPPQGQDRPTRDVSFLRGDDDQNPFFKAVH